MAIKKEGSMNQVRIFALVQLSSWIYRQHKEKTMKSIAEDAKCSAGVLSGIKNGTVKSISLARVLDIMDNLNVDYVFQVQRRKGITHYSFAMDKQNVRSSSSNLAEVTYKDEYEWKQGLVNVTKIYA